MTNKSPGWPSEPIRHALASKGIPTSHAKSKVQEFHTPDEGEVPPKELYENINWDTPSDLDKIIKLFWWCGIYDSFEWFKFDEAFELAESVLREKLGEHNRLPEYEEREYLENQMEYEPYMFASLMHAQLRDHPRLNVENRQRLREEMYEELNEVWKEGQRGYDQPIFDLKESAMQRGYDSWYDHEFIETMVDEYRMGTTIIDAFINLDMYQDETYDKIRDTYDRIKSYKENNKVTIKVYNKVALFDDIVDMVHHTGHVFDRWYDIPQLREKFEEKYGKNE